VVFGPVPRSYEHALPKKVRRAALRGALSHKLAEGAITVVEDLQLEECKTRRVAEILRALSLADQTLLIVIDAENPTLERSARNLPRVGLVRAAGLNVYDVLRHSKLLVTKAAIGAIETRLGETARAGEGS
jgi:large subunit ribosomal protein L4